MFELEERVQINKEILKTLRLLDIVTHPEKRRRLDKKLKSLFKRMQELEDSHKNAQGLIKCDYGLDKKEGDNEFKV